MKNARGSRKIPLEMVLKACGNDRCGSEEVLSKRPTVGWPWKLILSPSSLDLVRVIISTPSVNSLLQRNQL
jgi:hypothetical protein